MNFNCSQTSNLMFLFKFRVLRLNIEDGCCNNIDLVQQSSVVVNS